LRERYLVDTNAYVRIARHSDCVLGDHGGLELRLVSEITSECTRSARLQSVFPWMQSPPHPKLRATNTLNFRDTQKAKVKKTADEMSPYIEAALSYYTEKKRQRGETSGSVLSPPDKAVFFTAAAFEYGVVTDEAPMSQVCKEFGVEHMTTLDLLHHLHSTSAITRTKLDEIVVCWQRDGDEPKGWRQRYSALFGAQAPRLTVL